MNVLYIFDKDSSDQPESAMIIQLRAMGVEPTVICSPGTPFEQSLRSAHIETIPVTFRRKVDTQAIRSIRHTLDQKPFDLVHVFHKIALINYTLASLGKGIPTVTYRGIIGNLSYFDLFAWLSFLNPRLSGIICVCNAVREYLLEKRFLGLALMNPSKVVTIYKGHDPAWYEQQSKPSYHEFGIPEDSYVVGCLARLKARKGITELIHALPLIKADKPVYLMLLGKIEDERIHDAVNSSPLQERIRLLGFRSDARLLAGGFDIITLPSLRREGLPRAIIEGMSQGIPAVVTDSGGSPELVRNKIDGRVVPPGDSPALAEAYSWILADAERRRTLGNSARQRIKETFTVQKTAEETLQFYNSILHKRLKP